MAIAYKTPDEMDPANQHWYISLMEQVNNVRLLVESVKSTIMSRADIEAADRLRVLNETYLSDMRGVNERLARLEGGSGRVIAWLGAIFGAVGCLGTLASMGGLIFTIIWTLAHH